MRNENIQEKRQSKRYLCDEFFAQCSLQTFKGNLDITAIDFNRDGMGLFSSEAIPESGQISLSMHYNNPTMSHVFSNIPCTIVHCNLTEVGSHCGVRFNINELSAEDITALETIEDCLIKFDDPDNRYHLFGDD